MPTRTHFARGTLVRIRPDSLEYETHWMHAEMPPLDVKVGCEDLPWGLGDTGIVIDSQQCWENPDGVYLLVHTSRGQLGWILSDWAEVAQ